MEIFDRILASTFSAEVISLFVDVGVGGIVGVAMNAVGLFVVIDLATAHILRMCNWFQVSRIDAVPRSAQVVDFQTLRNSTNEMLVDQPMRQIAFILPATKAITIWHDRSGPEPTLARLSIWDTFIQQFLNRLKLGAEYRLGSWHSGNSPFLTVGAGGCFAHPSAHSFNHRKR